jgi:hypothetical protein
VHQSEYPPKVLKKDMEDNRLFFKWIDEKAEKLHEAEKRSAGKAIQP